MSVTIEQALAERLAACRAGAPQLDVETRGFVAHVEACRPDDQEAVRWLQDVHFEDLYLAFACATGSPAALRLFTERYGRDLDRVLDGVDRRGLDDAHQILYQRLFVGPKPKIATYTGRAALRRWLRVVASRILLEVLGDRQPLADERELAELPVGGDDPELAHLKTRYRAEYKLAFRDALSQVNDRDRTVLAQYYVDELTIDQLGALYSIHRATASRWIARAERELRDRIMQILRARLGASPTELRSLTRLVCSQLSLSLTGALGAEP